MLLGAYNSNAQYVTIPDTVFAQWLTNNYPTCMNGNQLDTTCAAVLADTMLTINNPAIQDITGMQYFKNLTYLDCSSCSLTFLPPLPNNLWLLNCEYNAITSLPALPVGLLTLQCNLNNLATLPVLPNNLQQLLCYNNPLDSLPALPSTIFYMDCSGNRILSLPALPAALTYLDCSINFLNSLPVLPSGLVTLDCEYNYPMAGLPALPNSLQYMNCSFNGLQALPALPASLIILSCDYNNLTTLPALPDTLSVLSCSNNQLTALPQMGIYMQILDCSYNQITALPALAQCDVLSSLTCNNNQLTALPPLDALVNYIYCNNNLLTSLPVLPLQLRVLDCGWNNLTQLPALNYPLTELYCNNNSLTSMPALPASLLRLWCGFNAQLTAIPALPDTLNAFFCNNDSSLTCLPALTHIDSLNFSNTAVTCLPNYATASVSVPPLNTVPLCTAISSCPPFYNIAGNVFYDSAGNCNFTAGDVEQNYIKLQLLQGGVVQQQVYTGSQGYYSFQTPVTGNYTVQIDTTDLPFIISCPGTNFYTDTIATINTTYISNNFSLTCRTGGVDLGVTSILNNYAVPRPASRISIYNIIGDISQLYGAHCAAGDSGTVQIVYSGPAGYAGPANGALTPTNVSGDTLTWNVPDFGAVNNKTAFNFMMYIDTFAIPGSSVCLTATVTGRAHDYNPSNNSLTYCFPVLDALDPNSKQVYPTRIDSGYQFLTYTIRFQNTGTAAAQSISIQDTLDSHLDPTTLRLLTYSANTGYPQLYINTNIVSIYFYTNLPDSAISDSLSQGYVQFGIRTKDGIAINGETVSNTASIYFDYNPAVVTNTVTDTVKAAPVFVNETLGICTGDSANIGTTWYKQTGTYTDTLSAGNGADSIVTLNLTVAPVVTTTLTEQVCTGDSAWFGSAWYYATGVFTDTLTATGGCDSIVTLNLTVAPQLTTNLTSKICAGDSVTVGSTSYSATGVFTDTLTATGGCDSIVILHLTVNPLPVITISWDTIVAHDDAFWQRYPGNPNMVAGWCAGYDVKQQFTLTGGLPPGGTYTGDGIHNNIMYPDSFNPFYAFLDTITYTYTDSNGCTNSNIDSIEINRCGFGINEIGEADDAILLYPNPTTGQLTIKTLGMTPKTISIYDIDGRLIYTAAFTPETDVTQLSSGLYFVEVTSDIGISRKRFVKM
jgi:uncharacterized repeat protein (TIGR01451 family)